MANNIKNRIEIIGTKEQIKSILKKFSTFHKRKLRKTHDSESIVCKEINGEFKGWYDETTNEFEYASKRGIKIKGLPKNIEFEYDEAFIQMPDFNKIVEMPESLNITSGSWSMPLDNQFSSHTKFKDHIDKLKEYCDKRPKDKEEAIDNMFKSIRNYIDYGYANWHGWSVENWGTKWNGYSYKKESYNIFTFETAWSGVPKLIEIISKEFPNIEIVYEFSDEDTGSNCAIYNFKNGLVKEVLFENGSKEAYNLAFKLRPQYKEYYKLINDNYEYIEED